MKLSIGAILAMAVISLLGACEAPSPAGDATPPANVQDTGNGGSSGSGGGSSSGGGGMGGY